MRIVWLVLGMHLSALIASGPLAAEPGRVVVQRPLVDRFTPQGDQPATDEVPDFQKHVTPLLGRLGCNGRACHGSFQGQGGFQLSLFGYDFKADHAALLEPHAGRVDLNDKLQSLVLTKPADADEHEGGERFEKGGWEYWVLRRWIEAGAPFQGQQIRRLERLEVLPEELNFAEAGEREALTAIAHWEDGTSEDVTCLCRFQSNDTSIAEVDVAGVVSGGQPGDAHVVVSYDKAVVPVLVLRPASKLTGDNYPAQATVTRVDELVVEKLKKLGIVPSELCTDEEFLRRASLDVAGTLPTAAEVLEFVADDSPNKRARKVDELLQRPGYAAQWTTFLCDLTGNNEDQLRNFLPQQVRPENQWYQWIYKRMADNMPYDQLVEGIVTASSRLPGESYSEYCEAMSEICREPSGEKFAERPGLVYYWARNNFRTAEERAIGFAYSFLGVRIQCAQCHKHPFDQWSKSDFDSFERLFNGVQANQQTLAADSRKVFKSMITGLDLSQELKGNQLRKELGEKLAQGQTIPFPELTVTGNRPNRNKNPKNAEQPVATARLLGGEEIVLDQSDVRGELMEWLRSERNPYFAKALVNRVWAQYFSVGIVNPPDDLNLANAPSNAPLLEYLARGFADSGYDFHWLHREILNSQTYQRSWVPNETNRLDKRNFSHALLRRLPAEAAYDAVRLAVVNEQTARQTHALGVPRALTQTGASARNNNRDDLSYALSVFGRSVRESNCDCDRSSEPSLLQTVFLVNDAAVQDWLSDPKTSWVAEVAEKYGWDKPTPGSGSDRSAQLQRVVEGFRQRSERIERRLAQAVKQKQTQLIANLEQQQDQLIRQAQAVAKRNGIGDSWQELLGQAAESNGPAADQPASIAEPASTGGMHEEQALWIAEQAYLRSLSRKPNAQELSLAISFLKSEEDPTSAVEGLLWSLINTKEFILNH